VEKEQKISQVCFNCWFYKEGSCEYEKIRDELEKDPDKTANEKRIVLAEFVNRAKIQNCPKLS